MDFRFIDGTITTPQGFTGAAICAGIKEGNTTKKDIMMVKCDTLCNAAAVYTKNLVKSDAILVTQEHLKNGKAQAIVANSGNANTCNADGYKKASDVCKLCASTLNIAEDDVIVASTGVIGQILPIEPIRTGIPKLVKELDYNKNIEAATAIMTTDTVKKEYALEFEIDGIKCHLGGMAKGSGMIHPNMATTLNFITTDCSISSNLLQEALSEIVKVTYNCLSIDGDTSTNDMVSLMANGMADNKEITSHGADFDTFKSALYEVMANLTRMLAKDGEGATKLIECITSGAKDKDTAITVAKSVVCSSLFKAAIFGEDANWGRILCAVGYAQADFDINKVDVDLKSKNGIISVCKNGSGIEFSEKKASEILSADEIYVLINLNDGSEKATAWGCDLTYDYVKINGDYRT